MVKMVAAAFLGPLAFLGSVAISAGHRGPLEPTDFPLVTCGLSTAGHVALQDPSSAPRTILSLTTEAMLLS